MILPGVVGRPDAEPHSRCIAEKVGEPFEFEGQAIELSVSVGVAVLPEDGVEMTALIDQADKAMYVAKWGGRWWGDVRLSWSHVYIKLT